MLALRSAVKGVLGASFVVSHAGPPSVGSSNVTVNVAYGGRGDETLLPVVFVESGFGQSDPINIGGGGTKNVAYLDLHIQTEDSSTVDGALLLEEIHSKVEALLRAAEKTTGSSFFTIVTAHRDYPPQVVAGKHAYRRILTVRGISIEKY